ncbi:Os11g0644600 [Oryza sativa Japonica Group]|nr:Os11g0644600 [Oryza sativa Japonica Group]|eukprot:NP_001068363.2 Os11g0644600 [Oryza sativa Japonica Group]
MEKTLETLSLEMKKIHAEKDAAAAMVLQKSDESENLRAELKNLHKSISELRIRCNDLTDHSSRLQADKNSVMRALSNEKSESTKLRLKLRELESYVSNKDNEIGILNSEAEDREGMVDGMSRQFEQLRIAAAEAHRRGKNGVWTWMCHPATTTVLAAASVVYAASRR